MRKNLLLKQSYGKALSILIGLIGDFDAAEDALHSAIERALTGWNKEPPEHPVAWLVRAARNASIDHYRKDQAHHKWVQLTHPLIDDATSPMDACDSISVDDDFLRLIFICCHPALAHDAQIVLTLRSVLGFEIHEIANALLISESAAKKRLVRVKRKIKATGIQYEIPAAHRLAQRLVAACDVVYLLFNEGYSRPSIPRDIDLCREAIRLARILAEMFCYSQDTQSLLALLLITHGRMQARYDEGGAYVPLDNQNRDKWDWTVIREGLAILDRVFRKRMLPTSYQLQAAISACHCRGSTADVTDWSEIVLLYERLEQIEPTAVIMLNRAIALICTGQMSAGTELLSTLGEEGSLSAYQPYHAARAFAYDRLGDLSNSVKSYRRAIALTESEPERLYLENELAVLSLKLNVLARNPCSS